MNRKLRWGVLSTANIGLKNVIPAMQRGQFTTVAAIASRDLAKAQQAAQPARHSHAPTAPTRSCWPTPRSTRSTIRCPITCTFPGRSKAAEAGKHVLCEKPLSLTAAEAETLLAVRARTGVQIGEAFMVNCHPAVAARARAARRRPHRRTARHLRRSSATSTTTPPTSATRWNAAAAA